MFFLFWSTARFICIYYYIALSRFSNALKIIAFSFILYYSPWLIVIFSSSHRISFHILYCIVLFFLALPEICHRRLGYAQYTGDLFSYHCLDYQSLNVGLLIVSA